MDDLQKQVAQIQYAAQKAKASLDAAAFQAKQDLADQESKEIAEAAKKAIAQIQYDAQK